MHLTRTLLRSLTSNLEKWNCSASLGLTILKLKESGNNRFEIRLPQLNPRISAIGDNVINKSSPILDFQKSHFFYITSTFQLNDIKPDLKYEEILNSFIYSQKPIISYDLPTNENSKQEKQADYYKHKDPRRFTHLTWIRHRKMKKHQRIKWRKRNLSMIKRRLMERNIKKEKLFRAELLAQIREAEEFDPREYVKNILYTIDNVPKPMTFEEKFEEFKDLIRKNRTQTNLTMPKFEKIK